MASSKLNICASCCVENRGNQANWIETKTPPLWTYRRVQRYSLAILRCIELLNNVEQQSTRTKFTQSGRQHPAEIVQIGLVEYLLELHHIVDGQPRWLGNVMSFATHQTINGITNITMINRLRNGRRRLLRSGMAEQLLKKFLKRTKLEMWV